AHVHRGGHSGIADRAAGTLSTSVEVAHPHTKNSARFVSTYLRKFLPDRRAREHSRRAVRADRQSPEHLGNLYPQLPVSSAIGGPQERTDLYPRVRLVAQTRSAHRH